MLHKFLLVFGILSCVMTLSSCTVVSIADAAVSTVVDVASLAVDATTSVVGAVIPDGDDDDD